MPTPSQHPADPLPDPAGGSGSARRRARWRRLNAATLVLWRAPDTVQLELGDNRVTVANVGPELISELLARPAASPDRLGSPGSGDGAPDAGGTATGAGVTAGSGGSAANPVAPLPADATELAEGLHRAGFLTRPASAAGGGQPVPAFLSGDLRALTGRLGDDAVGTLGRRRRAAVVIHGTARITVPLAATLAAAGVGQLQLTGAGEVTAAGSCPGGLGAADEGHRFGIAAVAAVRRHAPGVELSPLPRGRLPDLVVLTDAGPVDPAVRAGLHLDGLAHLVSTVEGSRAVIGPLVVPGRTSCLRCADLHRRERDPCWPMLAVQLANRPRHRSFSDVSLCVATAGMAAGQVLRFLDGETPETLDGTVECQLPDWRFRRRSWSPHHECDCRAAATGVKHGRMES
jgi:hypothetical protein